MYQRDEFIAWLENRYLNENTRNWHLSYVDRIDREFDLGAKLSQLGADGFLEWSENETTGYFERDPSHSRGAMRRFVEFAKEILGSGSSKTETGSN